MNCLNHPEIPAAAFCRTCGKPLCDTCKQSAQGSVYCEEHVPAQTAAPPRAAAPVYTPTTGSGPERISGPGVRSRPGDSGRWRDLQRPVRQGPGARQLSSGLLVSILSSGSAHGMEPLFGILIAAWVFYMAVEAYHTAQKRRGGEAVDEFSSLINLHTRGSRFPAGAVVLIGLGRAVAAEHHRHHPAGKSFAVLAGAAHSAGRVHAVRTVDRA